MPAQWFALGGGWSRPKIDKSANVLFALPIKDGPVSGALFLYAPESIKTVVANGDPAPPETNANLVLFRQLSPTPPPLPVFMHYTMNDAGTIVFTSELDGFSSSGTLPRLKTRTARILDSAIMRATLRIGRTGCAALGYSGVSRPCDYSIRLVDTHGGHDTFGEYPLNVNL